MGRAIALVLVTLAAGLLLYWLLAPRFLSSAGSSASPAPPAPPSPSSGPTSTPPKANVSTSGSGVSAPAVGNDVNTAPAVEAPRSGPQRETEDREAKRGPFYHWIRENMKDALVGWQPSAHDPATLELYAVRDDPQLVSYLLTAVVQPHALHYGFNHVYIYVPNPPDNVEHYRLDSEVQYENGVWRLFKK